MRTEPVVSRFATGRVRHVPLNPSVDGFRPSGEADPEFVAHSIRADFDILVTVFDRQLSKLPEGDAKLRSHIVEARSAAARGLQLSGQLIEVLRTTD